MDKNWEGLEKIDVGDVNKYRFDFVAKAKENPLGIGKGRLRISYGLVWKVSYRFQISTILLRDNTEHLDLPKYCTLCNVSRFYLFHWLTYLAHMVLDGSPKVEAIIF